MGRTNETPRLEDLRIRFIKEGEGAHFAQWEKADRPYPWTASQFEETARADNRIRTLVLEWSDLAVAYASVQVVEREAYLSNIMVSAGERRSGWGTKILQKVMMWAVSQGATTMVLDVDTKNAAAIGLYKKNGFEIVQERKASYPRGEDAFIMRKKL